MRPGLTLFVEVDDDYAGINFPRIIQLILMTDIARCRNWTDQNVRMSYSTTTMPGVPSTLFSRFYSNKKGVFWRKDLALLKVLKKIKIAKSQK